MTRTALTVGPTKWSWRERPRHESEIGKRSSFFGRSEHGAPVWVKDIKLRGAVFVKPGECYRSSVSYNAGLKRYIWCQTGRGNDTRFKGGLEIYDAPEPWGPRTTAFYTTKWDVGPGETSCLPNKWMSRDGATVHLVFFGRRRLLSSPRDARSQVKI